MSQKAGWNGQDCSMTVNLEDIQNLSVEVQSLAEAGLPLESHLADAGAGHSHRVQKLTQAISDGLSKGQSLENVVRSSVPGPQRLLTAAIAAGLKSGQLSDTTELLGDMANDLIEIRRQILQALAYPLVVLGTALLLFVVFIREFLRRLTDLIADHQIETSWWFRAVLRADGDYWWWPILFPALIAGVCFWWVISGRAEALAFRGPERLMYLIPGVRGTVRELRFYNLARILSLLVERDLPLNDALRLSGACSGSKYLEAACMEAANRVERGELPGISDSREWNPGDLPPLLAVGVRQAVLHEEQLTQRLSGIVGYYRRRLHTSLVWLQSVVPVALLMVIAGTAVILYSLTVFWPVVQIFQYVSPDK